MITGGDVLDFVLRALPILTGLGLLVWNVTLHKSSARKAELDKLSTRIDGLDAELDAHKQSGQASRAELRERMIEVEQTLAQMPDKDAVHRLEVSVESIKGDIKGMAEGFKAWGNTTRRIDEFLMRSMGGK